MDCENDGSIILTVSGGSGSYTYDWADLAGADNISNRTNLLSNTYLVTITDGNGCQKVLNNIILYDNCDCRLPVVVSIDIVPEHCGQGDGAATINLEDDESLFTFIWNPPFGSSNAAGNGRTGLMAGLYQVVIMDADNILCYISTAVGIGTVEGPVATRTTTPAHCNYRTAAPRCSPMNTPITGVIILLGTSAATWRPARTRCYSSIRPTPAVRAV